MIIVIVVLAVLILPLVVGSVFVCVPKWWTQSVVPHMPDWMTRAAKPISAAAVAQWDKAARILLSPLIFTAALAVWLIRGWFVIGLAAIEGVCPYNGGHGWRDCLSKWFNAGRKPLKDLSTKDIMGADE